MSEISSELDDYDYLSNLSVNVELDSYEALSTVSSAPSQICEFGRNIVLPDQNEHIVRQLMQREIGLSSRKAHNVKPPLRTYYLRKILPPLLLQNQIFMGMTRCGCFLLTYSFNLLSEEDEWNECIYRYKLHWWLFSPEGPAREIGSVVLFGTSRVSASLQIYFCQWPKFNDRVLVYGVMKETGGVDALGAPVNQRAYVTVTAVPSTYCPDCRNFVQCSILGERNTRCLKHCFTAHTSFDVTVPYPEFLPAINLKFDDFAVFNTNNTIHALKVSLDRVKIGEIKRHDLIKRDSSLTVQVSSPATNPVPAQLCLQEQIIRDFADDGSLTPKHNEESSPSPQIVDAADPVEVIGFGCMSPPLPTRIKTVEMASPNTSAHLHEFIAPKGLFKVNKKLGMKRIAFRPFFTRRERPTGMFRNESIARKASPYEFEDDSQAEVEQLSQFRRKLLADKTYEFQEGDENILPFSLARHGPGRNLSQFHILKPLNRNTLEQARAARSKFRAAGPKNNVLETPHRVRVSEDDILVGDMSGRYAPISIEEEKRLRLGLKRLRHCFLGTSARFIRCFVESDSLSATLPSDLEDDETAAIGYNLLLHTEVFGSNQTPLQLTRPGCSEGEDCVKIEQQTLDIEAICQSVANSLCFIAQKTYTFCNDYDIEVIDICPRSGDVLLLLMMRIEGCEGKKDENSVVEQYETSVTLLWNLVQGDYRIIMADLLLAHIGPSTQCSVVLQVVPPQKMKWAWDEKYVWNPARQASREIRCRLPFDVTLTDPAVRLGSNSSVLRGASCERIQDYDNGVQFLL